MQIRLTPSNVKGVKTLRKKFADIGDARGAMSGAALANYLLAVEINSRINEYRKSKGRFQ